MRITGLETFVLHVPVSGGGIGDRMQPHLHLAVARPSPSLPEYIPWMRDPFVEPATVHDGRFVLPRAPGAGTAPRDDALESYHVG